MNKFLTESGWKDMAKESKVKDNGLQQALATYEKLAEEKYQERLKALAKVGEIAGKLKKSKEAMLQPDVVKYLTEMIKAAQDEHKLVAKAAADAKAAASAKAAADAKAAATRMKLKYTYNQMQVKPVSEAAVLKMSNGANKNGWFLPNEYWDDPSQDVAFLTLTFKPEIYINNTLNPKLKKDANEHEHVHNKDCKDLADQLRKDIEKALKAGRDAEIAARMKWFLYDFCKKSAAFHAKVRGYDVEMCSQPAIPRPN